VLKKLHKFIAKNHVVAEHTKRTLSEYEGVKDFCEEARCFAIMPATDPIYLHYDTHNWLKGNGVVVKIVSIGMYDEFMEYERARISGLHSADDADIPNIN